MSLPPGNLPGTCSQGPEDGVVAEEAFEQVDDAQSILEVATKLVGVMPPYGT